MALCSCWHKKQTQYVNTDTVIYLIHCRLCTFDMHMQTVNAVPHVTRMLPDISMAMLRPVGMIRRSITVIHHRYKYHLRPVDVENAPFFPSCRHRGLWRRSTNEQQLCSSYDL